MVALLLVKVRALCDVESLPSDPIIVTPFPVYPAKVRTPLTGLVVNALIGFDAVAFEYHPVAYLRYTVPGAPLVVAPL